MISVIIPTYNRLPLLQAMVASLQQQQDAGPYEMIPVDDGSVDGTSAWLAAAAAADARIRPVFQANRGPAAARNAGAAAARGTVLAFTDDDCVADPHWVASIRNAFSSQPDTAGMQGQTWTDLHAVTPLTHQIHQVGLHPAVPTCNAAYRRAAFEQAGGFDPGFPSAHNEDADLAWRIRKIGPVVYEPAMRIHHPPRQEAFRKLARRMRMLRSEFRLYYKDPAAYRAHRNTSPWVTIYGEVFFYHQLRNLKSRFRFANRPALLAAGLALSLVWWVELVRLLPEFVRADRQARRDYA